MENNYNGTKIDYSQIGTLFGLALLSLSSIPIILRITQKKSAEEISYITPIMILTAFIIFSIISYCKGFYLPLLIFIIGIFVSSILLLQKILYEKSKEVPNKHIEFDLKQPIKFPDPNMFAEST